MKIFHVHCASLCKIAVTIDKSCGIELYIFKSEHFIIKLMAKQEKQINEQLYNVSYV